jgi:three-Cys-motif partner protein
LVKSEIDWAGAPKLPDHSKRKHKILEQYVFDYLLVRCQPPSDRFKLAIVDGFAGAGRYECGSPGSPIIFIEQVRRAVDAVNNRRVAEGLLSAYRVNCLLVLNDKKRSVVEQLRSLVEPMLAEIQENCPNLTLDIIYYNNDFETLYPEIRTQILNRKIGNVLFNLDQYGHIHVSNNTIDDILSTFDRSEIFYTFMIKPLLTFLSQKDPAAFRLQLARLDLGENGLKSLEGMMSKPQFLALAERLVFEHFGTMAPFVSPFSIHNPAGWKYWLIHFTKRSRGRQVYNDVLHTHASHQAHSGRAGIYSLGYDERLSDAHLHLFRPDDRQRSVEQLHDDIPRLLRQLGDAIPIGTFFEKIYNWTPAHADDINKAIMDNQELAVLTGNGGERRKPDTIHINDTLVLTPQRSFFAFKKGPPA